MYTVEFLFKNACPKERGFSLLDVMIAMGLGATAIVTTMAVITQAAQVRRIENLRSSAVAVREQLIRNMARYDNFQETIHNNAQFDCLVEPIHQCNVTDMAGWEAGVVETAANKDFNLMYATGGAYTTSFTSEIFYEGSNLNAGFSDDGLKCTSSSRAPNKTCPIRADLYWWSLCSGVCNPGLIGIKVVIKTYNDANKQTVVTPYGFSLIKSVFDDGTQGPFPDPP